MAATKERVDNLAVMAAMELMDIGWCIDEIAAALQRSAVWLKAEIDKAIADDSAAEKMKH